MDTYFEYRIKGGDTLSLIIFKMFGFTPNDSRYAGALQHIMSLNPQIKNPNRIVSGDLLHLGVIPENNTVAKTVPKVHSPAVFPTVTNPSFVTKDVAPADTDSYWALSWLEENSNFLTIPGSIVLGAKGNLVSPGNLSLLTDVSDLYADYKNGIITKGQYDYRRALTLTKLRENVGPMEKFLFGNKTTHQSIRIARGGGIPATAHIEKHAVRLNNLAKVSKVGGVVLIGVGLTASCIQIANTKNSEEKNEIFVETVASTSIGVVAGFAVGLFLVSNPIGWGTALVLAAGSAAISYGSGKTARYAYDKFGNKIDFVSGSGVDNICQ